MWPHFTADELIILFSSVQALTHDQLQASPFSALPVVVVEMILHRKVIKLVQVYVPFVKGSTTQLL